MSEQRIGYVKDISLIRWDRELATIIFTFKEEVDGYEEIFWITDNVFRALQQVPDAMTIDERTMSLAALSIVRDAFIHEKKIILTTYGAWEPPWEYNVRLTHL